MGYSSNVYPDSIILGIMMNRPLLLALIVLAACSSPVKEEASKKPNIIYIMADDLGYGDLGAYGQKKIKTPHIDALAESGMVFTQHYSGSPVCAPSRYILLTGKHSGHAFIRGNHEWGERGEVWNYAAAIEDPNLEGQYPIEDDTYTFGDLMQSEGYKTALVGKWGLGGPLSDGVPNNHGFDLFYGYNCQRQAHNLYPRHLWKNEEKKWLNNEIVVPGTKLDSLADINDPVSYDLFYQEDYAPAKMQEEALQFIESNKDNPFFLYYATPIPHLPLQVPREYVDRYVSEFGDEEPYIGGRGYFPHQYPDAAYAGMITYLDDQVGELIGKLKELGLYDNTLIIFTSDNGPTYDVGGIDPAVYNSAGLFQNGRGRTKGYVYEGGIRVPMIASWPGKIAAGTRSDHISAFWDVMPTLAEITGSEAPLTTDGISYLPALLGEQQPAHDFLYWEFPAYNGQQAVRLGKWKGIRKDMQDGNLEIELYNLDEDILEKDNVAADNTEIVRQIERIMDTEHTTAVIERFRIAAIDQ
jgi:arylsulfatase